MRALAGTVLTKEGWLEGHVVLDAGRVVELGGGAPPVEPVARGVVVPAFVNAHTHLGDAAARGDAIPQDLAEAVAPPHGYKHRVLASLPPERLIAGMRDALAEIEASGARGFVDFREGGAQGLDLLDAARAGSTLEARVYARPPGGPADLDAPAAEALLARAGGFGVSSLADEPRAPALAAVARKAGKGFALHHSEAVREPLDPALDLRPELLVHLTRATRSDLARVAEAGVQVVVCPRSNASWVRSIPDVRAMLDLDVPVGLGSDNAMLGPCDVRAEARALLALAPRVRPDEALRMMSFQGWRLLHPHGLASPLDPGATADFLVFRHRGGSPAGAVLGPDAQLVHRERSGHGST